SQHRVGGHDRGAVGTGRCHGDPQTGLRRGQSAYRVTLAVSQAATSSAEPPHTDPGLGIYNSRYLYDSLARETARARHSSRSVSLIIAGLDELQQIIETHGQDTSAALLQHAVNLTRSALRQGDWMARHEEREFAIVLPETHLDGAYSAAERMRRRCTENPFALPTSQLIFTASFGVACIDMNAACSE